MRNVHFRHSKIGDAINSQRAAMEQWSPSTSGSKITYNLNLGGSGGGFSSGPASGGSTNPFAFPTFGSGSSSSSASRQQQLQAPIDVPLGGSIDYGRGGARPDEGPDTTPNMEVGGYGRNSYGAYDPPAYRLSARQMGSLLGTTTGIPSQLITPLLQRYGQSHPENPFPEYTPGVTVTDIGTGATNAGDEEEYRQGQMRYGDDLADLFRSDAVNYWDAVNPGQGLGGDGRPFGSEYAGGMMGGGGGAPDIYAGSASPWSWGANPYF